MKIKTIFIMLCLFMVIVCCERKKETNRFCEGQIVRSVISENIGQIIKVYRCNGKYYYDVRFVSNQNIIPYHLLGSGGPIDQVPLAIIDFMHEYELKENE